VLFIEPGTELAGLSCRACHCRVRPGECVLVAFRKGKPNVIHAHVCGVPLSRKPHRAGPTQLST
jgi:hypothetical protein